MRIAAPLCRAREGELPRSGKRGWPGPRLGAPNWPGPRLGAPNAASIFRRGTHCAPGGTMRLCAAGTQEEGEPQVPPASCESPPLPSGRAARVRASDAFRLPPGCRIKASGTAATPERCAYRLLHPPCRGARCAPARHPAGAPPSWKHWAQALHRQRSRLPGSGAKPYRRDVVANQIFHSMWTNLFAIAGSHERLPAGVIRKRGQGPLFASRSERACEQPPLCGGS